MHITPKRRRRALRAHYLVQRGNSQRQVAETMELSRATVRADLQLIETHWSSIAAPAADDLLLESLQLLNLRLAIAIQNTDAERFADRLTPVEYMRAREAQDTQLNALAREIRRTVHDVHQRAEQRPDQPDLYEEEPTNLAETMPESTKIDHPETTISSPEQEIVPDQAPEEKTPPEPAQPPDSAEDEALIQEAIEHFPHLKGQSEEQILTFLDQLTNPETENPPKPTRIYAEAAG